MILKKATLILTFLLLLLLALTACGGGAPTAPAEQPAEVPTETGEEPAGDMMDLGGREVRIAVENAYPPFNFIDESGNAVGYDYDIFREACNRLNCTPVFIETSWDAIVAIMGGQGNFDTFDIGADGITITAERAEFVDFSIPYIEAAQVILARVGEDRFSNAEELAANSELLVGSQPGTTNYDTAAELVGEERIVAFDQFGVAVQALIQDDVDAVIMDNVAGQGYVGENAESLKIVGEPFAGEELGFIFPKGSDLLEPFNKTLEVMQADGTMDTLYAQWFLTEEDSSESSLPDMGGAELRVAIDNAYPPFSYIDDTGEAIGYDYDIFREICTRLNCTPVFLETSWDAIVAVMGGQGDFDTFDVGADGITITPERAENVDFTNPYIQLSQVLLVRIDEDRFQNIDELVADSSLLLGAQPGTTNYDLGVNYVGESRVIGYESFGVAVQALIQGDVDGVPMDNVAGIGYVGANPDKVRIIDEPLTTEELGFILPKNSEMTPVMNAVLAEMAADGTLDALFTKWFATEE